MVGYIINDYEKEDRLKIYRKYDGHCAYCGKSIEYKDMQVDHLVPKIEVVTLGGATRRENLSYSMAMIPWRTICHLAGLVIFVSVI